MHEQENEQLMLFREDSHASPFPWLESKKVKGTTVTYGRKCSGLSENLSRVGYLVRTYLESCELPLPTLSRTWSVKDLTSSCLILKLRLSALSIAEKEFLSSQTGNPRLWKTPVAADGSNREFYRNSRGEANLSGEVKLLPTPRAQEWKDTLNSLPPSRQKDPGKDNLTQRVAREMLWPTPTTDSASERKGRYAQGGLPLTAAVYLYATPQHRDYRTGQTARWENPDRSRNLNDQIGGQLNPTWVEWLMGFPTGWTELNASETP